MFGIGAVGIVIVVSIPIVIAMGVTVLIDERQKAMEKRQKGGLATA